MRVTRFPRLLSAALAGVAAGAVAAAGWNFTAPELDQQAGTERAAAGAVAADPGGAQDRRAAELPAHRQPGGDDEAGTNGDEADAREPTPLPKPSLDRLEQPSKPYPTPDLPGGPGEESAELTRIQHALKRLAWTAAGLVDDDTESSCTEDEETLTEPGEYEFSCDVTVSGATVRFGVTAEVHETEVHWEWTVRRYAIREKKVVYEATRQSFKPARVTCNFSGVELVPIGLSDGISCWVTEADGDQITYRGEVLEDGSLVFRADEPSGRNGS